MRKEILYFVQDLLIDTVCASYPWFLCLKLNTFHMFSIVNSVDLLVRKAWCGFFLFS